MTSASGGGGEIRCTPGQTPQSVLNCIWPGRWCKKQKKKKVGKKRPKAAQQAGKPAKGERSELFGGFAFESLTVASGVALFCNVTVACCDHEFIDFLRRQSFMRFAHCKLHCDDCVCLKWFHFHPVSKLAAMWGCWTFNKCLPLVKPEVVLCFSSTKFSGRIREKTTMHEELKNISKYNFWIGRPITYF